jgi:hypothetical protein
MTYYGSGYGSGSQYIDNSQVQPHNRLNASDPNVILMKDANHCNKPNIFTSGNETNFNF